MSSALYIVHDNLYHIYILYMIIYIMSDVYNQRSTGIPVEPDLAFEIRLKSGLIFYFGLNFEPDLKKYLNDLSN